MTRTFRARRLALATGVGLVVVLLAGATFGAATSHNEPVAPATFTLAQRHGGDKGTWAYGIGDVAEISAAIDGTYMSVSASASASGGGESTDTGSPVPPTDERYDPAAPEEPAAATATIAMPSAANILFFEWLPEAPFQMADGSFRAAHGLMTAHPGMVAVATLSETGETKMGRLWNVEWTESTTSRVLGQTTQSEMEAILTWTSGAGSAPATSFQFVPRTVTTWTEYAGCTLGDELRKGVEQGQSIPTVGCGSDPARPLVFQSAETEAIQGVAAVRFNAQDLNGTVSYWFNPGIPEPLRVRFELAEPSSLPANLVHQRELISFEPGDGPWDAKTSLPAARTLPDVAVASRQPWGADDAGVVHPFPASAAWEKAATDLVFTDFADYLAAHPDAVAVQTDYDETKQGSRTARTWTFSVSDGSAGYQLTARQTEEPAEGKLTDLLGRPPATPGVVPPVIQYQFSGQADFEVEAMPDEGPATLPTAASVLAFWQAFTASNVTGNAWRSGHELHEVPTPVALEAGITMEVVPADPLVGEAPESIILTDFIGFDAQGRLLYHAEQGTGFAEEAESLNQGDSRDGSVAFAVAGAGGGALRGALSPWDLPPPAAAGVGLAAIISGALAFLWPALKGTPILGLFSRVKDEELLEHPARQQLMAVIEARPGIHYQELLRATSMGHGSLEHHLKKLETAAIVHAVRTGRYTCYFPKGIQPAVRQAQPALKSPSARLVLRTIQATPGISGAQVATATGLAPSSVSEHVKGLTAAGLVSTTRLGRLVHLQPTATAAEAVALAA